MTKPVESTFESSRLGEAEVHSARFACDRCRRVRALYFRVGAA